MKPFENYLLDILTMFSSSLLMLIGAIDIFKGGKGYIAAVGCLMFTGLILFNREFKK